MFVLSSWSDAIVVLCDAAIVERLSPFCTTWMYVAVSTGSLTESVSNVAIRVNRYPIPA